jgi:hypothetical protein
MTHKILQVKCTVQDKTLAKYLYLSQEHTERYCILGIIKNALVEAEI